METRKNVKIIGELKKPGAPKIGLQLYHLQKFKKISKTTVQIAHQTDSNNLNSFLQYS